MAGVSSLLYYNVADVLGVTVEVDGKGKLSGHTVRDIDFGGLPVEFRAKIVASRHVKGELLVLARVKGNLALLVESAFCSEGNGVTVHLLNLAKMDAPETWFDHHRPASAEQTLQLLGKAVVKSFKKVTKDSYVVAA
ncbi:hypothetical protein V3589_11010 [Sinorhizobium fredii]|uniref:hypothetical protein n=1 Tax=Rhizobium fredii TaxID=380 RepID=UPI0030ABF367